MQNIEKTAETLYSPLTQNLGIDWSTALFIQGLAAGGLILYAARVNGKDSFEIRDGVTISGLVSLGFLGLIDYLSYKGLQTSTYIGSKIVEVASLTIFFAVLTVAWILWSYKWPGKYEVFQNITG